MTYPAVGTFTDVPSNDTMAVNFLRSKGISRADVRRIDGKAYTSPDSLSLESFMVTASAHALIVQQRRQRTIAMGAVADFIGQRFTNNDDEADQPWHNEITLSLADANKILALLWEEEMKQQTDHSFTITVTYEVTGTIKAPNKERAEEMVQQMADDLGCPEPDEPHGLDIEWEDVSADVTDTDVDVSEA